MKTNLSKSFLVLLFCFFSTGFSLFCQTPNAVLFPATVLYVLDGDTLVVYFEGQKESVRLLAIDCPEIHYNPKLWRDAKGNEKVAEKMIQAGLEAKKLTQSLVPKGSSVNLEFDSQKRDKYNRLLAYVYLPDGQMLNAVLFKQGAARAYLIPPNVRYASWFKHEKSRL